MQHWAFLTNHARVLLCLARDPEVRLREVAAGLGITERSAYAIVADLAAGGYVVKRKHGRRNRYQIQVHLPLAEPASGESAIGDVLTLVMGDAWRKSRRQQQLNPEASPHDDNHAPRARRAKSSCECAAWTCSADQEAGRELGKRLGRADRAGRPVSGLGELQYQHCRVITDDSAAVCGNRLDDRRGHLRCREFTESSDQVAEPLIADIVDDQFPG